MHRVTIPSAYRRGGGGRGSYFLKEIVLAHIHSLFGRPYHDVFRSSRPEVFCKKGALRNFARFTGKHLRQSLFFNKIEDLNPATSSKKSLWHRCFPVNFAKFLRTSFLQNTSAGCFYVF